MKFVTGMILLGMTLSVSALQMAEAKLRSDIYPYSLNQLTWIEAWDEQNQFFPRYYKPSATIQLVVHNDTDQAMTPSKFEFDGHPIEEETTRPDFSGRVIWYRMNPEVLAPGASGHFTVRLREKPDKTIKVAIEGKSVDIKPESEEKLRILYVAFNNTRDRLTVFTESLEKTGRLRQISIDGKPAKMKLTNADFSDGNPAVAILDLEKPLRFGAYFILKVETENAATFEQIRTRDDTFPIGIIGANIKLYTRAGFNTSYCLQGSKAVPLEQMTRLSPVAMEEKIRKVAEEEIKKVAETVPANRYIYGNYDEADAHEPPGLPYMERCGINIMQKVEPLMALQRRFDPTHLTALLIDRTYAPLNWYTYGALADLPVNDCYIPTIWHGMDSEFLAHTVKVFLSATSPRASQMLLWATANTNHSPRATTPIENEAQYHYALGSGAKGLHYFTDWTSFPQVSEGGYYIGAAQILPLWRGMARGNALADRLKGLLNNAYPWNGAKSGSADMWCGALLSGDDSLIITVVNRNIKTSRDDKMKFVHTYPVGDSFVEVELPVWFKAAKLCVVAWDKVTEIPLRREGCKVIIPASNLEAGRIFVISSDAEIAKRLAGTPEIQGSIAEIQKIPGRIPGERIAARPRGEEALKLSSKKELTLDFKNPEAMKSVAEIRFDNAILETGTDGTWNLCPGKELREARAELYFVVESDAPEFRAELRGETVPGYLSSIELGIKSKTDARFATDSSMKPKKWYRGRSKDEFLAVSAKNSGNNRYEIRIVLKDPLIVTPEGCTAAVRNLILSKVDL